jgi:succinate dehydrogenase / fumarate reductase cytochrome b subunit
MWPWILQRASAALLLFFVMAHLWIQHFLRVGASVTYRSVMARLVHGLDVVVDFGLLAVVVYHGLNGLRAVLLDRMDNPAEVRALNTTIWVLGCATFVFGMDVLSPFLFGRPWFRL